MDLPARWNSSRLCHRGKWRTRCSGCCCLLLFNDGYVLQLRSETVAVRRRMIYGGHMITGDECGPSFLTCVFRLSEKPRKNLNREIDPTGIEPWARWVRGNDVTPRPQPWSGVLGQTGSNSSRKISTTQRYKNWFHSMTNVSIPEVNLLKNNTLALSVPINLSIEVGFVSVNCPRETYFVDELRIFFLIYNFTKYFI